MLLFSFDLPLVELIFAFIVVIVILLLEAIIILAFFSRQLNNLSGSGPFSAAALSKAALPSRIFPTALTKKISSPAKEQKRTEQKPAASLKVPTTVLRGRALENELGRVQQELSRLEKYQPPRGVVRTIIPPTRGHETSGEAAQLQKEFDSLQKIIGQRELSKEEEKAQEQVERRAYREVQKISQRLATPAPANELAALEAEIARLRKGLKK